MKHTFKIFMALMLAITLGLTSCGKSNADLIKDYAKKCEQALDAMNDHDQAKVEKLVGEARDILEQLEKNGMTDEERQEIAKIDMEIMQKQLGTSSDFSWGSSSESSWGSDGSSESSMGTTTVKQAAGSSADSYGSPSYSSPDFEDAADDAISTLRRGGEEALDRMEEAGVPRSVTKKAGKEYNKLLDETEKSTKAIFDDDDDDD